MKYLLISSLVLYSLTAHSQSQEREAINVVNVAMDSFHLPSMSAAVYKNDKLIFYYTNGISDVQTNKTVCDQAPYHIGSITKSMTATMIAFLVQEGKLNWSSRIIDVFPGLDSLHSDYVNSTLIQLLSHSSGLVDLFSAEDWRSMKYDTLVNPMKQRTDLMIKALQNQKNGVRGKDWVYANLNYSIAALMAEQVSKKSWKELIQKYIVKEIGVKLGFGWISDFDNCVVPKGHVRISDIREGYVVPEGSTRLDDIYEVWGPDSPHRVPISIQPAGDVHMKVSDLAKYGYFHILGLTEGYGNLSKPNFEILHKEIMEGYALGWNILPEGTPGIPGKVQHQHLGSGGTFTALLSIFPEDKISIAVIHNGGGNVPALGFVLKRLVGIYAEE